VGEQLATDAAYKANSLHHVAGRQCHNRLLAFEFVEFNITQLDSIIQGKTVEVRKRALCHSAFDRVFRVQVLVSVAALVTAATQTTAAATANYAEQARKWDSD
jgi:hypothetical protein